MNYEVKGFFTVQLRLTQNMRDYPLHFPYNTIKVLSLTSTSKLCAHFHRCRRGRSKNCFSFRYVKQALWWLIGRLQINIEERAFPLTDVTFNWACECPVEHEELLVFIFLSVKTDPQLQQKKQVSSDFNEHKYSLSKS